MLGRNYWFFALLAAMAMTSCDFLTRELPSEPVARVNDSYLFKEDLTNLIQPNTSAEDSILIVTNYINRWATQQLLIDQARLNLSESQLATYDQLVDDYKADLYTKGYKNAVVSNQLDSSITAQTYQQYYEKNKESFVLKERLLKLRYIYVGTEFNDTDKVSEDLKEFDAEAKEALEEIAFQFKRYYLNDSTWVRQDALLSEIPLIAVKTNAEKLKKSNFVRLQDSIGVYLIQVQDALEKGDDAPLEYVRPTIQQIILNKRKLDLIKKLEADITKDAIKNNDFEVYQ
ncbi:peptidylprolyl isomerase [Gilvibacter sediminis]|uniref:peptidylprolyl isomerase n=1 Tax=Gilvibacter sediminis TaxID=379071 RepID=UPI002350A375|nr:peptidylprolyl isomerase [Gilvibacter sediminis]MDC7999206.1 peptidylprolyl isomerase [Gilvibacter sediminis]